MNDFTPIMLTVMREARRLSQTALAKDAGLSQSAVSQMEAGILVPSDEAIEKLAVALRCQPTLLRMPIEFRQLPITFFRKKAKVGVRDVNAIRARVNLYRMRIEILLRSYELSGPRIILADLAAEGISATQAAQRLRVYWNIPPGPIKDITDAIEARGIIVVPVDFENQSVDGLSLYEPSGTLPPMIFVNAILTPDRWRLTLAHELGHIVLHHHLRIPSPDEQLEQQAYEFAVELLTPGREISGHLRSVTMHRLAQLKQYWRVSMACLLRTAQHKGLISDRKARGMWIQLRRGGVGEPVEIEGEEAKTLRKIIRYYTADLGYTTADLCRVLHHPFVEEFRSDFGLNPARLRLE